MIWEVQGHRKALAGGTGEVLGKVSHTPASFPLFLGIAFPVITAQRVSQGDSCSAPAQQLPHSEALISNGL